MKDKNVYLAKEVIEKILYITIATVTQNGKPWNSPIFAAFDKNLNFYWSSHPKSQHSINIAANGKAFIVIYDSKAGEGEGTGVYIEARAEMITNKIGIQKALDLLGKRRGTPFSHINKFLDGGLQRIYKAEPKHIWLNDSEQDDEGDYIEDFRIAVSVSEIGKLLK